MRIAFISAVLLLALASQPAFAQGQRPGSFNAFQSGQAIFHNVCQGCHMPDAKGAVGAGKYPALAANKNLETAGYPVAVVVNGQKGMPWFGDLLNDNQIANVVNYVRTNFGNHYTDRVSPQDVHKAR
jgi:mono/diheme cytochrome c family protein